MVRSTLRWLGRQYQRRLGVSTPYFDDVVRHAPGAILPILGFIPATAYGHRLPPPALHMVRLGATTAQSCGICLDIGVRQARRAGVSADLIEAAIGGEGSRLEPALEAALRFGERLGSVGDAPEERELIREHYGTAGLVEASIAVAGSVTFPVLQRGLGYGSACSPPSLAGAGGSNP